MALCHDCNDIIQQLNPEVTLSHVKDRSIANWEDAVKRGCPVCAFLYQYKPDWSNLQLPFGNPAIIAIEARAWLSRREYEITLDFVLDHQVPTHVSTSMSCRLIPDHGTRLLARSEPALSILTEVADLKINAAAFLSDCDCKENTLAQARQWLTQCISTHTTCSRNKTSRLPTRLIRVTCTDGIIHACVVESAELPTDTEYITLSHCWGEVDFFTLTPQSLVQCRDSIPLEKLSPLFQDALQVTRDLGFAFIWIDSLCILQGEGPDSDWLQESLTMDQVYGNSICNLAATAYADGTEGLLPKLGMHMKISPSFRMETSSAAASFHALKDLNWGSNISTGPLHRRGWVFQEQIMAPRIIHFTKHQIYWECSECMASELFPQTFPKTLVNKGDGLKKSYQINSIDIVHLTKKMLYEEWLSLTQRFSYTNLTRPQDRLPALSGLAKTYSKLLHDDYLAGLWRQDLHRGILWTPWVLSKRATPYRAPTWSWASVDGMYNIQSFPKLENCTTQCSILEASVTPLVDGDRTGQVVQGYLVIRGYLQEFTVETSLTGYATIEIPLDGISPKRKPVISPRWGYNVYCSRVRSVKVAGTIYLMPVLQGNSGVKESEISTRGLLLQPTSRPGEYEKVGTFLLEDFSLYEPLFCSGVPLPDHCYEEYDGQHEYTIRIV